MNNIPAELVEHIFVHSEPPDFASLSSCCRRYHDILYNSKNQIVWRAHFLRQFDNPRTYVTVLGEPVWRDAGSFDWKGEFQRRFRAQSVLADSRRCRPVEVASVLRTLISMIVELPGSTVIHPTFEPGNSKNLSWLLERHSYGGRSILRDFIFHLRTQDLPSQELQDLYQLHTRIGLVFVDLFFDEFIGHQAIAFRQRSPISNCSWGPYQNLTSRDAGDSSLKVDWRYIHAAQNIFASEFVTVIQENEVIDLRYFTLQKCQAQLGEESRDDDWVGVNGTWVYHFCLIEFHNNDANQEGEVALDWDATQEISQFDARLEVTEIVPNPLFPTRPTIRFAEEENIHSIQGSVNMTSEQQIRWKLEYTSQEFAWQAGLVWSFDGVQVGFAENFGVLGTYFNPIRNISAPAWLRKMRARDPGLEGENNG
ncbi:hypothetical protein SCHPADRAFT_542558 [Schizopora paradoxa]|uniref:F-box domain-containing protein n=1 Tax=Schizopora paradoxa TaxID=27342 RepID=A0A0H2REI9_9AGAM|nr:hypothetical protein SCHPADRAFT_542558 [Schizopora paradoxa]